MSATSKECLIVHEPIHIVGKSMSSKATTCGGQLLGNNKIHIGPSMQGGFVDVGAMAYCTMFCFACLRMDATAELVWADGLGHHAFVCHHCLLWRCRHKRIFNSAKVWSPPDCTPDAEAQLKLNTYLRWSWSLCRFNGASMTVWPHYSASFRKWLFHLNKKINDTCAGCGGRNPHGLYCGESRVRLFACCKTCIKHFMVCPTLTIDDDNHYWCVFDFVRTSYGSSGCRELWIGTVEFLYWLCEDERWFRELLHG